MPLPQTLQPNQVGIRLCGAAGFLGYENVTTLSDAELATETLRENLAKEANDSHTKVLQAIDNWGALTLVQKDQLLKFLAKFYIVAGERLGLFVL